MSFLLAGDSSGVLRGFLYNSAANIQSKIAGFKIAGSSQLQVLLDFDRTLTEKHKQASVSWQLMRNHLPPDGRVEAQKVFDHYRAIELAEKLTVEDAVAWWTASMSIIIKYRLDMKTVEQDFLTHSTIRPGTKELFALCAAHNIPTIIMSAGIKDVIEIWCKVYDIHPTIILSTSLKLDTYNRVIGWDESSIVHTLNKKEIDHPELSKIRLERSHTILAGDSMHDFDMAEGDNNVLRVRIYDPLGQEETDYTQTFDRFDTVIEDGTLFPIVNLLEQIISLK